MAMQRSDFGPVKNLHMFDIRNGDVKSAVSLLTKAAIPAAYKWVPVGNLPAENAVEYADMFIKSAYLQLAAAGAATMTDAIRRKIAIALGLSRAVITSLYRITENDLIPGETMEPSIIYTAPVAPAIDPTWTLKAGVTAAESNFLNADFDFTEEEKGAMSDILMSAAGIPAIQGASLMACGHHYLSDAGEKSRPFFEVIEKQFWSKSHMKAFTADCKTDIQNAMWHKAGHPVNIQLKLRWAVDPRIAEMLRASGSGSSASRLPARESNLKAADTALTLLINVRPFYANYGGRMDSSLLAEAINLVAAYQPAAMGATGEGAAMPGVDLESFLSADTPKYVNSRATALEWVDHLMRNNVDKIAMAFGFYEALTESTQMVATTPAEKTLLGANSLLKLKHNAAASYQLGREAYGDYKAFKNTQRSAGLYQPIKAKIN